MANWRQSLPVTETVTKPVPAVAVQHAIASPRVEILAGVLASKQIHTEILAGVLASKQIYTGILAGACGI